MEEEPEAATEDGRGRLSGASLAPGYAPSASWPFSTTKNKKPTTLRNGILTEIWDLTGIVHNLLNSG